jgi:enoyl-CoA hydratase/carnithine racemase
MTTDEIRRDDREGVITLTLSRDDKMNAMTPAMFDVIETAVGDLGDRDDLRVLVITAEGRFFTAGLDVSSLRLDVGTGTDGTVRGSNVRRQYRADAQSHCMGVGVELGSSCDFRLASDAATFGLPEVPNLAVLPGSGGISRLTRLVGPHWAKWMVMAGETISADDARAIGFVHAVYPAAEFRERVDAFAHRLAAMPREALGLAKVGIDTAATVDRRTARDFDRMAQTLLFTSDDFRDRVNAFRQRGKQA